MTSLYGSQAEPERVFGTGAKLQAFYRTMEQLLPLAWKLNSDLQDLHDPNATAYHWVMPDNFHVHIKVEATLWESVVLFGHRYSVPKTVEAPNPYDKSLAANLTHSVDSFVNRELVRRCSYDPRVIERLYKLLSGDHSKGRHKRPSKRTPMLMRLWKHYTQSGFLSARIFDYVDETNLHKIDREVLVELLDSLPAKRFDLISIHDCWRVLPAYGNDLRKQYAYILSDIAKSDLLKFLVTQIAGKEPIIEKGDPDMWKRIRETEYALS